MKKYKVNVDFEYINNEKEIIVFVFINLIMIKGDNTLPPNTHPFEIQGNKENVFGEI